MINKYKKYIFYIKILNYSKSKFMLCYFLFNFFYYLYYRLYRLYRLYKKIISFAKIVLNILFIHTNTLYD